MLLICGFLVFVGAPPEESTSSHEFDQISGFSDKRATLYGVVRFTNGTFFYYDPSAKEIEQPENPQHWFWVQPSGSLTDEALREFISGNLDRVFKIIGSRLEDDCGYYGDACVAQFSVSNLDDIQVQTSDR